MRKIIFRGKRKDNGEWVFGWYSPFGCNNIYCSHFIHTDEGEMFEVHPDTISQFTGSYDQKEKDCFHKDIVKYGQNIGIIEWDDIAHSWCIYIPKWDVHSQLIDGEYEIIGNIHDNPELLTSK